MWIYEKKLQFPVNISCPDAKAAAVIISQLGGPDGEMAAALRYLSQRYTMPDARLQALLTDIGTEELSHVEIISAILYQLCDGLSVQQIKDAGLDAYFVDHTLGIYPQSAAGVPFTAAYFQSKGDPITDLTEDMAAEQKARTTYDNILRLVDNEEVRKVIRFLRQREIVHYQRFAEGLEYLKTKLDPDNVYKCNPSFDKH
ncbi:MAG TPA: manganese catalase family protein [Candidatus Merdibacter merdavium]|uniref:Manganese catalase family protein n=1 Tax=Candidatus Merdibacter merdavium TaxID=2838692 RepID=A0A9D2SV39_9FIRM|nr:manganese catalase family protein [Candidatus Merdibacter merdavium]